jgi:hypothetical protein
VDASLNLEVVPGIEALVANGPHPDYAEKLNLFGRFVGDWDVVWLGQNDDGTPLSVRGECFFFWVLEGRAIQDVWIVPSRQERGSGAPAGECGTSIRFYDPRIDAWRVSWNGPAFGNMRVFVAREIGTEIVLEGIESDGRPLRWVYSDIELNSFRWSNLVSNDEGQHWDTRDEQRYRRRRRV